MRWRGEAALRADVAAAGLDVEHVFGGWHGEPVGAAAGELLVLARKPPG